MSGRSCGGVDGLKLDWGEFAEASLPAPAVVFGLDPGTIASRSSFLLCQGLVLKMFFCSKDKTAALIINLVAVSTGIGAITFYAAMLRITGFVILAVIFAACIAIPIYMRRHARYFTGWSRIFPSLAIVGLGVGVALVVVNVP